MDLMFRVNVLKDSGQINERTYNIINNFINLLKADYAIELNEENGAMLITHLCIALTRIDKNETVKPVSELIFEELKNDSQFNKSNEIIKKLEELMNKEIPESEKGYIQMHICVLLNKI